MVEPIVSDSQSYSSLADLELSYHLSMDAQVLPVKRFDVEFWESELQASFTKSYKLGGSLLLSIHLL